ncbi:conoCAP-like [Lineus longissimus]|uniref:conoCAP-like n=1 Tax=Lineus longissimus TaxID=88925 RepID=UPI002B4ED069
MLAYGSVCYILLLTTLISGQESNSQNDFQKNKASGSIFPYGSADNDLDVLKSLRERLDKEKQSRAKRPFCNSYYGCGNGGYGKRSEELKISKSEDPSNEQGLLLKALLSNTGNNQFMEGSGKTQKRAFCNGFYGCANGKRSGMENVIQRALKQKTSKMAAKRPFCNAYSGCGNGKKRSVDVENGAEGEKGLLQTILSRLRSVESEGNHQEEPFTF